MRIPRLPLLLSILFVIPVVASHAADEPAVAAAPETQTLFVDLRTKVAGMFYYGSWKDKIGVSPAGITIEGLKGAQGDGGMGRGIEPARDLSEISFVEVALGVGAKNEVAEVTVALNDADGTQVAARLRIDQIVPNQAVWLHVPREGFTRVAGQDGRDGKMDWTNVAQWHLQGDWATHKALNVVFISLRVRK